MVFDDVEYWILRLIRKYFFTKRFLSIYGDFIPYYRITSGQSSPISIVKKYLEFSSKENLDIKNKIVLEIGVGVTNSTCYELACRGAKLCYAYEPHAQFNKKLDNKIISKYGIYKNILNRVMRIKDLNIIENETIDAIFSNSVLEHVENINELCQYFKKIMKDNAWMIHIVDYRDHFFKYQFRFYKFSKKSWKMINPGLSRLRVSDHIKIFHDYGFRTKILNRSVLLEDFIKFKDKNKINGDFRRYNDNDLATTYAVIFVKKNIA